MVYYNQQCSIMVDHVQLWSTIVECGQLWWTHGEQSFAIVDHGPPIADHGLIVKQDCYNINVLKFKN